MKTEANTISSWSALPCHFLLPLLSDHMLCSVTWVTDERVAVQWVTRKQNYVVVQIYDFDETGWQEKQVAVMNNVLTS